MPSNEPVLERPTRGLDHGAWVPLKAMYPEADIPVLQMSMPDLDPEHLFEIGKRLAPLRDEGVLIVGSGFMTHGLPFIDEYFLGKPGAPQWSMDFDQWAMEALNRGDVDTLFAFREKAPGMPYAHPTVEHFAPLFVTLGAVAKPDEKPEYAIEGYAYGLSKRSFEARYCEKGGQLQAEQDRPAHLLPEAAVDTRLSSPEPHRGENGRQPDPASDRDDAGKVNDSTDRLDGLVEGHFSYRRVRSDEALSVP